MWNPLDGLHVEVLSASRAEVNSDWGRNYGENNIAFDPYARLYCMEAGRACVTHHSRRFDLRPGGLHVIPANTVVRLHCDRQATISYLHFTAVLPGGMDLFDFLRCPFALQPKSFRRIVRQMNETIRALQGSRPGKIFEVKGLVLQLLSPFLAASDLTVLNRQQKNMERFSPVLQYIDANLHCRITLAELAGLLHLEPTYFSHQFADTLGLSPMRYVLRRRVERAQRILWNTEAPLKTVAQQLGFTDAFHFSKTFKRIFGLSPSRFRRRKRLPGP